MVVTASEMRNHVLSPRRRAASVPEVRVTTSRAESAPDDWSASRKGRVSEADRVGPGRARWRDAGRIERHRQLRVGIESLEKALLRRRSAHEHEPAPRHRERLGGREGEEGRFGRAHACQRRSPAGGREELGQLRPKLVVFVAEVAGAQDPPGAVLQLEHAETGEPHRRVRPSREDRSGRRDRPGPQRGGSGSLARGRRRAPPVAPEGPRAPARPQRASDSERGLASMPRFVAEPSIHLAADAQCEDGERHQNRQAGRDEETSPETHGLSARRSVPS